MITSRMVRLGSLLCVFVLCIGVGACAPAEQAAPTPGATLLMIPPSATSGAKVSFYGSGFQEGEEIFLEIVNAEMKDMGTFNVHTGPPPSCVVVNASGAWSSDDWNRGGGIIRAVLPGVYTLRATGNKGTVATTAYIILEKKKK